MDYSEILANEPYAWEKARKEALLTERLRDLTARHMAQCAAYRDMLTRTGFQLEHAKTPADFPALPVRLFKQLSLKSVPDDAVFKTMTSSGTTGQAVSKIYLDRTTASNQQKTLARIVTSFTGSARMPMLILDCPSVVKNRLMFSARGAGILGFSMFGTERVYALDDEMQLDVARVSAFLEKHAGERILLFGFTFMVWQHFYKALVKLAEQGIRFDLSHGILIHGGGWKKLVHEAVSPAEFQARLTDVCGLSDVHDYYGMVEQTGCIYMQCECGHLHASLYSDVLIRHATDLSLCDVGETGLISVCSMLPESYPGHVLLTEDMGVLLGEDDCPCGRKGKYFSVLGRIAQAEIRGCSDTYAAEFH